MGPSIARGALNLGELARQRHGTETVIVGFTTYTGTVTAGEDGDLPQTFPYAA